MNKQKMNIPASEVTEAMIEGWKAQGFEVTKLEFDGGKVCYMRNPTRQELSFATSASTEDPLRFNEALTESCWLAGDDIIKTHAGLSLSLGNVLKDIIGIVEVKLAKL